MGQRLTTYDDLDGTEDDTVAKRDFSVGRHGWEIDLSDENFNALLEALSPYIAKAKKVRGPGIKARSAADLTVRNLPGAAPADLPAAALEDPGQNARVSERFVDEAERARFLEWVDAHSVTVGRRGRPPKDVLAAFRRDDLSLVPERYLVSA